MRLLLVAVSVLLATLALAWGLGSDALVARWSGVLVLGGWALAVLAPALVARTWPGFLATTGLLALGLGPEFLLWSGLLVAPWIVLHAGHAWRRLQSYVASGGGA